MIRIKEFDPKKVILTDGKEDKTLVCTKENEEFHLDLIEQILDYANRKDEKLDVQ